MEMRSVVLEDVKKDIRKAIKKGKLQEFLDGFKENSLQRS